MHTISVVIALPSAFVSTLAPFLLPDGFARPTLGAALKELSVVPETARHLSRARHERRSRRGASWAEVVPHRNADPVILVPGFMAGDGSLSMLAKALRRDGMRTYRSHIHANVGCTLNAGAQLEARLESIAIRRGSRVQIVGHSLGGLLARGIAVRRPDLVSGIVTMGSPMLAPAAHHAALTASLDVLIRLSRAGWPGLMSEECVRGSCARQSFQESREPLREDVSFTAVFSRRDGIVDWRACIDPLAASVEVTASHAGMAVDPQVRDVVVAALRRTTIRR